MDEKECKNIGLSYLNKVVKFWKRYQGNENEICQRGQERFEWATNINNSRICHGIDSGDGIVSSRAPR